MQRKIIVICGPTATGKTRLAVSLAKKFNGEIISADSRQIYKYMDIGTGKERFPGVNIQGYDLALPNQEFSVKNYVDYAHKCIRKVYKKNKLPVLVGGTGLYIKAVVDNLENIHVPRNLVLREKLIKKNANELFGILMKKSPSFAMGLNESDRLNPRRLLRALEIVSVDKLEIRKEKPIEFDSVLWTGLRADKNRLEERIEKRVDERLKLGFEKEMEFLKKKGYLGNIPRLTLGYGAWIRYMDGQISKDEAIKQWKIDEKKYAKRQMVWFKKEKRIIWFDVSQQDWQSKVADLVEKWDNSR